MFFPVTVRTEDGTSTNFLLDGGDEPGNVDSAHIVTGACQIELTERLEQLVCAFTDRFPDAAFDLTHSGDDVGRVDVPGLVAATEEAVENAVKHNDSTEPTVKIRVRSRSGNWVDIAIEDDGPGIPDQELEVLSTGETPLNHADRLGLWFIYWVVSRVGGQLSVTKSDPRGSTLTLSVPRRTER